MAHFALDPTRDLVLERTLDIPVDFVWAGWTDPKLVMQWFTPAPWKTVACEIDLRPGGFYRNTMESPEGDQFPNEGCILEVVPQRRLVWTSAMTAGFRPSAAVNTAENMAFSAVIEMEPLGPGATKYTATGVHPTVEAADSHRNMGFHEGWGAAIDQLVALYKSLH